MVSKVWAITKVGSLNLFKLIRKYWYMIILIIVILPVIISSVSLSMETQNPSLPFVQLGLYLSNADAVIYENVQILKEDPAILIGMQKPTEGIWNKTVYYWHILKVIWKFFGLIWLITFPFFIIYKILRLRQTSEPAKNIWRTAIYGLIFILIINLIMTIYYLIEGSIIYNFPEGVSLEYKTWIIIITTLPFHGVFSLVYYLISLL